MAMNGQRMTAEEFLVLDVPEWPRMELVDGEIVVNTPNRRHQDIVAFLVHRLYGWTEGAPGRGRAHIEVDHKLDDRNVYAPDVWWAPNLTDVLPTIVAEVSSPSTWRYDRDIKKDRYLSSGVPEVWLVDTKADVVHVHTRTSNAVLGTDDTLTSPLLPGFTLRVAELFDR